MRGFIFGSVIGVVLGVFVLAGAQGLRQSSPKTITLEIFNNHPISLTLETKCDNIPGTNNYRYFKRFTVQKRTNFTMRVPSELKYCEIYGLGYSLF